MLKLNLPEYEFKFRKKDNYLEIFDSNRSKYVKLTPEEWVRQNFIMYMVKEKNCPLSMISVEKTLKYNELTKKTDVLIYNQNAKPALIVECKAPTVQISQKTFEQIARYNFTLRVKYLIVTNGIDHFCCKMDYIKNMINFVNEIPDFGTINVNE